MGTGMENADAGHLGDEVAALLNKADAVAHKAVGLAERFYSAASGVQYPDNAIGASARRVVESHTGNRVGQMDTLVARLDKLIASTDAAVRTQDAADGESADALAEAGRDITA